MKRTERKNEKGKTKKKKNYGEQCNAVFLESKHTLLINNIHGIQWRSEGLRSQRWHPKSKPKVCLARLCASIFVPFPSKMKEQTPNGLIFDLIFLLY